MKEAILVSACLLGQNTKYNGKNNYNEKIELLKNKYEIISVCPEVIGGLPTPRFPSEIIGEKVINNQQKDVTKEFTLGAIQVVKLIKEHNIKIAVLKEGSPSCGSKWIYDGSFTGKKIPGQGITSRLLLSENIQIFSENEIDSLLEDV